MINEFFSGFVSIIGKPNVGKSTLMNCLIGEKISIISDKPQTTRNKVLTIMTGENYQAVFLDTPGIHKPKSKLGEYMVKSVDVSLNEIDVVMYVIDPNERVTAIDSEILKKLENVNTSVFLVINKIDTLEKSKLLEIIDRYQALYDFDEILPVSALKADNTEKLVQTLVRYLPEGPKYFPEDMITDQPERQIISEIIREKALIYMQDEIPHGVAVEIMSMKERKDKELIDIQATIYCEKDSHKGMIIGKKGAMLKKIGIASRLDSQALLGISVNLQLWVKVKKDWRDSDFMLKSLGYNAKDIGGNSLDF